MNEPKVYYTCDPALNINCSKTHCHLNGGPCTSTTKLEFAKQPVEKVRLVLPMSEEDAKNLDIPGGVNNV